MSAAKSAATLNPTAKATAKFVRVTPMKARRVIDLVRGKSVDEALDILLFAPQAASDRARTDAPTARRRPPASPTDSFTQIS